MKFINLFRSSKHLDYIKSAKVAMEQKDWQAAANNWKSAYTLKPRKLSPNDYLNYANALQHNLNFEEAVTILHKGQKLYPKNEYIGIELAILQKKWNRAIDFLNSQQKIKGSLKSFNYQILFVMLNRIVGNHHIAISYFKNMLKANQEQIKNDKQGYRKIILFDNGESRIEYYKKLVNTNNVIVTFDSINMEWDNNPFAFKLLMRQDVDIIAVRKRKQKKYFQDLSYEDFYNTVHLLISGYDDKAAYGFSLGAYATLYYASRINCRILAISPRLSIHPTFGKRNMKGKEFSHETDIPYNPNIEPVIVYDPKNPLDNRYINQGILPKLPNAHLVEIPYGGHGMAPHLKEMGVLKQFVITYLNDKEKPIYNKEDRKKSSVYYRVLGEHCLKRNKPNWALQLAEKALDIDPNELVNMKLKIRILISMKRYREGIQFAKLSKEKIPRNKVIRYLLIDLYINNYDEYNADKEIDEFVDKFGVTKELIKRIELLNELIA